MTGTPINGASQAAPTPLQHAQGVFVQALLGSMTTGNKVEGKA